MIGYLEGEVQAVLGDAVLLRTPGGVGYEVRLPLPQLRAPLEQGAPFRCYVVTVVREDELSLYGFEEPAGKALFELLITVSGVGPKAAMAFLSAFSPEEVSDAIVRQDVALLATIPSIGKKTASRLCVELSDRLAREAVTAAAPARDSRGELISALTNLGFPEKDVLTIMPKIPAGPASFSQQLKQALTLLGKN
jgi:Holliday junction DNA helicase RuvA